MIFIRIALTAVLLWAVYGETGAWTTVAFALVALTNELTTLWMRGVNEALKGQGDLECASVFVDSSSLALKVQGDLE